MTEPAIQVARVLMPEKGIFVVRCPVTLTDPVEVPAQGALVVVNLDYGPDVGELREVGVYEPSRDGPRPPGFTLVRAATEDDKGVMAQNEVRSREMRDAFLASARRIVPDIRVSYVRLSFGKSRLFIRFTSERLRPDLSSVQAEIRKAFGLSVNAWQMGPRDEVRVLGSLGACGRACCCCTWQQKYPSRPVPERIKSPGASTAALNGVCGRYKCCLSFED